MRDIKGQNLIEYVLLVTAVLIVCIVFLTNGTMTQSVNSSLNSIVNELAQINSSITIP